MPNAEFMLQPGLQHMWALYEHLRREGAVETVGDVMLELDPSQRALVHSLGIQDHVLRAVGLRHVELDQDVAIVLIPHLTALPAQSGHKYRLPHHAVGVPHLTVLVFGVILKGEETEDYN